MTTLKRFSLSALFLLCVMAGANAQTGPGTVFFFGTHHAADQLLEPYPSGGFPTWFIVRAPQPASYYSFNNLLDVHSVTVYKNGSVLTARGDNPDYGYFVISDVPTVYPPGFPVRAAGFAVVLVLRGPILPTDVLRVSFDYVQQ